MKLAIASWWPNCHTNKQHISPHKNEKNALELTWHYLAGQSSSNWSIGSAHRISFCSLNLWKQQVFVLKYLYFSLNLLNLAPNQAFLSRNSCKWAIFALKWSIMHLNAPVIADDAPEYAKWTQTCTQSCQFDAQITLLAEDLQKKESLTKKEKLRILSGSTSLNR